MARPWIPSQVRMAPGMGLVLNSAASLYYCNAFFFFLHDFMKCMVFHIFSATSRLYWLLWTSLVRTFTLILMGKHISNSCYQLTNELVEHIFLVGEVHNHLVYSWGQY